MARRYVFGAPTSPAPVDPSQWAGLDMTWTGWNGFEVDLTDALGGTCLVRGGVEGLHFPRIEKFASESAAYPGRRIRGSRALSRDVFWPLYIWSSDSEEWMDRQRAFFDSIHPEREGTWTVKGRDKRSLQLTGVFDDPHAYDQDPFRNGHALYQVTLEAAQPYWAGETIIAGPWQAEGGQDYIPAGGGPPFYLSSGATFGSASVRNPGDVDMYVTWVADAYQGPLESIVVGVDSALITVPFDVPLGKMLRINTDPRNPSALLGDAYDPVDEDESIFTESAVDVTADLGLQDYAPIPPGAAVPVQVSSGGSGVIRAEGVPLFYRAF